MGQFTGVRTLQAAIAISFLVSVAPPAVLAQDEIDCGNPGTQVELNQCAVQAWEKADAELNRAYQEAMANMKEADSFYPDDMKGAADALKEAQRAWIPFRDKACVSYGFLAHGGSMEPQLIYDCKTRRTRERTEELRELVKGLGPN